MIAAAALGSRWGAIACFRLTWAERPQRPARSSTASRKLRGEFEAAGRTHSGARRQGQRLSGSLSVCRSGGSQRRAAARSRGSTTRVRCESVRSRPARIPGRHATENRIEPTVTDANVVLGRLNPRHLLGGAFPIDAASGARRRSIARCCRRCVGSTSTAAAGIVGSDRRRDGEGAAHRHGRARPRSARLHARRVWRRRPAARVRAGRGTRHDPSRRPAAPGLFSALWFARRGPHNHDVRSMSSAMAKQIRMRPRLLCAKLRPCFSEQNEKAAQHCVTGCCRECNAGVARSTTRVMRGKVSS